AMQQAVELTRREGPAQAPTGFHARVMEAVRDEPAPGGVALRLRRVFTRVPVEALALAAAALVVISVVGGRPGQESPATDDDVRAASELTLPASVEREEQGPAAPVASADAAAPTAVETEPPPKKGDRPSKPAKSSGVPVPTEPMKAEWEKQPQAGGDLDAAAGKEPATSTVAAYRLIVRESNTLYSMNSLAKQYSGKVSDSRGRPLSPRPLTQQDDFASLLMAVPEARARALHTDLAAMGGERISPPATAPKYGTKGQSVFIIEVRFTP
ncbi:MAG: hypothetical protein VX000_04110, partial [Myxococcota bacterium]|nr:hypothetical protein [Myxococcota bacterium]